MTSDPFPCLPARAELPGKSLFDPAPPDREGDDCSSNDNQENAFERAAEQDSDYPNRSSEDPEVERETPVRAKRGRNPHGPWGEIDVLYHPPPRGLSEVTVPAGVRWMAERIERYVASRTGVSESWRKQTRRALGNLVFPCGRARAPKAAVFVRLGFVAPMNAGAISRAMIETLRDTPAFAPTTRQNWTSRLRGFLAFEGLPIAAETDLWRFVKPVARKRPYLDPTKARTILARSEGRERLIVALGLFNGLRECEIARLRVRDFELAEFPPMVWVLGKGERGGKPRRIPVNPLAYGEVLPFLKGRRPEDPVYPGSYSTIDHAWRNAQRRAGFQPVGTHALRRSFGRISHDAGTPIEEIQAVMGHSSPGTTAEYIGVEETRIAKGMARMAAFFQEAR